MGLADMAISQLRQMQTLVAAARERHQPLTLDEAKQLVALRREVVANRLSMDTRAVDAFVASVAKDTTLIPEKSQPFRVLASEVMRRDVSADGQEWFSVDQTKLFGSTEALYKAQASSVSDGVITEAEVNQFVALETAHRADVARIGNGRPRLPDWIGVQSTDWARSFYEANQSKLDPNGLVAFKKYLHIPIVDINAVAADAQADGRITGPEMDSVIAALNSHTKQFWDSGLKAQAGLLATSIYANGNLTADARVKLAGYMSIPLDRIEPNFTSPVLSKYFADLKKSEGGKVTEFTGPKMRALLDEASVANRLPREHRDELKRLMDRFGDRMTPDARMKLSAAITAPAIDLPPMTAGNGIVQGQSKLMQSDPAGRELESTEVKFDPSNATFQFALKQLEAGTSLASLGSVGVRGVLYKWRPLSAIELRIVEAPRTATGVRQFQVVGSAWASTGSLGTGGNQTFSSKRTYTLDELAAGPNITIVTR